MLKLKIKHLMISFFVLFNKEMETRDVCKTYREALCWRSLSNPSEAGCLTIAAAFVQPQALTWGAKKHCQLIVCWMEGVMYFHGVEVDTAAQVP